MTVKKSIKNQAVQVPVLATVQAVETSKAVDFDQAVVSPVENAVAVGGTVAVSSPVAVVKSISLDIISLINAPKTKAVKVDQPKKEKSAFKNLNDQYHDYVKFSLSVFGYVASLNDIKSLCRLSSDFDDAFSKSVLKNGLGSVDHDDNYSGKILFNGCPVVSLVDHQFFCYSKSYNDDLKDKNHAGLYSWQVAKFLKALLIAQAVKNQKSLEIAPPSSCPFVSLSWSSYSSAFKLLGCEKMTVQKIDHLKTKYDGALIDSMSEDLLDIDIQGLFNAVLNFAPVVAVPVAVPVAPVDNK